MTDTTDGHRDQTLNDFQVALNRNGYGFQQSIISLAKNLHEKHKSAWLFEAAEFPVEVQGKGTRIDILMKLPPEFISDRQLTFMVAECKRANPAMSNWCFIPSPYTSRRSSYKRMIIERVGMKAERLQPYALSKFAGTQAEPYHVAIEVKSSAKGESMGAKSEAIEDAASQVCRGLNGLIRTMAFEPQFLANGKSAFLLPVIFTTAQLWTSDDDLSTADLLTGNISLSEESFKKRDWLVYEYHMSPGLKHGFPYNSL